MIWFLSLLVGIIFFSIFILIVYARWNYGILESLNIPVVKPHFFLGSLTNLHKQVTHEEEIERYRKLGPVYGLYQGRTPQIYIVDPELIRLVFVKDFEHFKDRDTVDLGHPIPNSALDWLPYDAWKLMRANWTRTFSSRHINQISKGMEPLADEFTQDLIKECNGKRMEFDIRGHLVVVLMDIITTTLFGVQMVDRKDPNNPAIVVMREVLCENVQYTPLYNLSLVFPFLKKFLLPFGRIAPEKFRTLVKTLLNVRNQNNNTPKDNVADSLLDMQSKLSSEEYKKLGITEDAVMGFALELFFAVYDSTGTAMTFLINYLAEYPEIQEKVYNEIAAIDGELNHEAVNTQLPYLMACYRETLRLTPPFLRPERVCTKDWEHNGLKIPKGMTVMTPIFAANRNPELWPNPDVFDPDRFLPENKANLHPYGFTSFGFGPKMCPGTKVASEVSLIILSRLIKEFYFEARPESKNVDFKKGTLFFIQYKSVVVDIVPRN